MSACLPENSIWERGIALGAVPAGGMQHAETVVIGAGIAGLSTALHLARQGCEVVVLEASSRMGLATRASAGIITGQLVRNTPSTILRRLGYETGSRLLACVAASARETFALVAAEGLECDAMEKGFLAPFFGNGANRRSIVDEWQPWRDDVALLSATETTRLSGCDGYAGAVMDRSGGAVDPAAYADALARRLLYHGGQIFTECTITSVSPSTSPGATRWHVTHANGTFKSRNVVLAANGGNMRLHAALRHSVLPLRVLEIATVPLDDDLRHQILPERQSLTDLETDVFSIRFDSAGRLITALPAPARLELPRIQQTINARLAKAIPGWRPTPLQSAWRGTAWLRSDCIPRMPILGPGLIAIQACNGRGLAINTVAGREAAEWLCSDGQRIPRLPTDRPTTIPGFAIARHIPKLVMSTARMTARLRSRPLR